MQLEIFICYVKYKCVLDWTSVHERVQRHTCTSLFYSCCTLLIRKCKFKRLSFLIFLVREMLPCQLCAAVSFFEDTTNSHQLAFSCTAIISDPKRLLPSSPCFTEHKLRDVLFLCHNEDRCSQICIYSTVCFTPVWTAVLSSKPFCNFP